MRNTILLIILTALLTTLYWTTPLGQATGNYLFRKVGLSAASYATGTMVCQRGWTCVPDPTPTPSPSPRP